MQFVTLSEIVELYEGREMSAAQVARHLGITREAVSQRLKNAGIPRRPAPPPPAPKPAQFERSVLEKLYIDEGLTVEKVAERLNAKPGAILKAMQRHGIDRRKPEAWTTKYPQLRELKIGESADLPRKANWSHNPG